MQPRTTQAPSCRFGLHARTVWKPAKKHDLFQYGHCPRCQRARWGNIGPHFCWAFAIVVAGVLVAVGFSAWWAS